MTPRELKDLTLEQLLTQFIEIGLAQDGALLKDEHAKFNQLYRQMDEVDNELRARGPTARLTLTRLFDHPNLQVRLRAATRALAVAPSRAREVIEAIAASRLYPQAGDAGMLLSGLDDGTFKPI